MEWYYYAIIAVFAVVLIVFLLWSNNKIKVSKHKIKSEFAPKGGIKIVHLSDLHGKRFFKNNNYLLSKIKTQAPNYICVTGDIIHNYNPRGVNTAKNLLKECLKIAPVLYVCGNHELRYSGYENFKKQISIIGVTVLDDSIITVNEVAFYGVKDSTLRQGNLKKMSKQGFSILLAHEPQFFEEFVNCGYNLVLCGHAHGGQWRIPFTGVGLYAPGQGVFPKYISGRHSMGATDMIISRGLGNSEFPLRLFNTPEVVVIEINRC